MNSNILIIESNTELRTILATVLMQQHFHVATVSTIKQAMYENLICNSDLILLDADQQKPCQQDFATCISSLQRLTSARIIALTADFRMMFSSLHAGLVLMKPLHLVKLVEHINQVLSENVRQGVAV